MTKRNQRQIVENRKQAKPQREAYAKYAGQNQSGLSQFKPTDAQEDMLRVIKNNTLSFVQGPAGVGKTAAILWYYCQEYLRDSSKKIVVVRTPVEAASLDKVGFLPDDLSAKIAPHFESTKQILNGFLGKGKVECDLEQRIFFKIPNYMVGSTIDNALVLTDECYTDKHDFLTENGWKNVKDISEGDRVCQYNADGSLEFVNPLRVIHKEYEGEIVEYNVGNVSYSVTPNHRMVYLDSSNELTIKLAKDSSGSNWNFITSGELSQNVTHEVKDEEIKMSVALQADGYKEAKAKGNAFQIQLSKERKINRFQEINKSLGNKFHEIAPSIGGGNNVKDRRRWRSSEVPTPLLDGTKEKNFVLSTLLSLSLRQRKVFIEELKFWDGSDYSNNGSGNFLYSTTNKHNVDVVLAVAALSGYTTTISQIRDGRKETYKTQYKVMIKNTNQKATTQKHDALKKLVPFLERYIARLFHLECY